MLTRLDLKGWKSFGDADTSIRLGAVSILVGPNGAGKSNALDAIRFLHGCALDFPFADVLQGRYQGHQQLWPGIRGGVAEASRFGGSGFTLGSMWSLASGLTVRHTLEVSTTDDPVVVREELSNGSAYYHTHAKSLGLSKADPGSIRAAYRSRGKGNSSSTSYDSHRLILGQVQSTERMDLAVPRISQEVRAAMREVEFFEIQPSLMRDYRRLHSGALGTSGENISPVLLGLRESERRDVTDWLSELCASETLALDFEQTKLGDVMLVLVENGTRRVSARSASDGMLRLLGLIAALLTVPVRSLLVTEAPDAGLHPSRIRVVAELLETIARDRNLQIVATTHSPTLLAHFSEDAFGDVVAFARDGDGSTVAKRLKDFAHFETLRKSEHIEELISSGWIERAA